MIMLVGDKLEMKKVHPCGGNFFSVLRIGSDIKIRCDKCGREVTVSRVKLEKGIKRIITPTEEREKVDV